MNIGVILAAGDAKRFGGYKLKQYLKLNGKEVFYYTWQSMLKSNVLDKIILVLDKETIEENYFQVKYNIECIIGGKTRNESIKKAIDYVDKNYTCEKIIFQDSVRPLVDNEVFESYINLLDDYDAVATKAEIIDALATSDLNHVNRSDYYLLQTPEAFSFSCLKDNFSEKKTDTAIITQLKDYKYKIVKSNIFNMKITYPEDLFICEQLSRLNYYKSSTMQSFDKDFLNQGKVLLLGGSGGVGKCIQEYMNKNNIEFLAPTRKDLDLSKLDIDMINNYVGADKIVAIINAAAIYYDDSVPLSKSFNEIFDVNVKSNLVLIEYAKTLDHKINLVMFSSSSSTKGRENITNYSSAKAALNSIIESQASCLYKKNIFLNAIIPEKINTPLIAKLHKTEINTAELLEPEDVIEETMYLATCNEYGKLIHIRKGI